MNFTKNQIAAENRLIDDLLLMARAVQHGLLTDEAPSVWRQRRHDIAILRRRIRVMRQQHLGPSSR